MASKNYSEEFRQQAVDLYESTPGATVRGIVEDLGIERDTLRHWLERYVAGKKTAANGTLTRTPLTTRRSSSTVSAGIDASVSETPEQQAARLQARVAQLEAEKAKLTTEREILRSGGQVSRRGDELVNRFQFVADHQHAYEVKRLCELVEIERSSFYAWQAATPARRARVAADAQLAERIRTIHQEDNTMGAPRITAELNDGAGESERVNHKRVAQAAG